MFNKRPINLVHKMMNDNLIKTDYDSLISNVISKLDQSNDDSNIIAIDGTNGADFHSFLQKLITVLEKRDFMLDIQNTKSYLKSGLELRKQYDKNITENRAFGYVIEAGIEAYFINNAQNIFQAQVQPERQGKNKVSIVFGTGAAWLVNSLEQHLIFLDVSREYQQVEHKKQLLNFGMDWNKDAVEKYKIAYFVEWPILENYRKKLLNNIDDYVDMNQSAEPVTIKFSHLKEMIEDIVRRPLRVKPFFAPGIWGGQRLKEMADLPKDWVNCAWSFEPIAPENSILIGYKERVIEVPFLIIMALESLSIMGQRSVNLFGDYFPIRFDYLDTIEGDSLSCQVHPKQAYITEHFNEKMTQQESYYILENKDNAKVYLGLTENNEEEFKQAVTTSQETELPINFTDYVNEFDTNKGDLYLIPPGTVHTSGTDNLVLEISSTTWWFTFKIYDFLRKDSDGKPRPLNVDHGFKNIDFYKDTDWVKENLMPEPRLINAQGENEEYLLGQREDLLFCVRRIHLENEWLDNTNDEFVMLNLVDGEQVQIVSCTDESVYVYLSYAESYILPSVFGAYKIVNTGSGLCKIVKAGVSPNWDVSLIEA